ncbi:MAG: circularly permuted type 2 ATP-grasp protein, partial [Verrucomicrobiales bacterium]|nr:circularly permuted type 2 ATP-grasp protein [Verrucomicrobiales bacterium]
TPWADFFESCHRHGRGILGEWRLETARLSRERGLAYHVDVAGAGWELDPVPWILSAEEWSEVEAAIGQRLRFFEALYNDFYGEQKTLKSGMIPPEILLRQQGFIRSLRRAPHKANLPGLGISGFDFGRLKDGRWIVLNDRFDCAFGLGLALENRTVVNQVLPNLFRRCQTKRIGHFFKDWFNYLADFSDGKTETPGVVILDSNIDGSPESDFLSNYCGIPRVVSSDLTVRNGSVWLRGLSGLEPIHTIWKRDVGRNLDPLGIPRGTFGGVPGVFRAMKLGNVGVSSHPGVQALESPGLYPFTAKLCRELLGEELLIPNVQTWWGGDPEGLRYILDNLPRLVIKEIERHSGFGTHYGRLFPSDQLGDLRAKIRADPQNFIGQEELDFSTIPTSSGEGLVPRCGVLRGFGFNDMAKNPQVMPGGLGRVGKADGSVVSTRTGGASKDIWVRSNVLEPPISIADEVEQSRIRLKEVITSRTGENLYWAGRYAERTDFAARFSYRIIESSVLGFSFGRELEKEHESLLLKGFFEYFELGNWFKPGVAFEEQINLLLNHQSCPASVLLNLESFNRACLGTREKWSPRSLHAIQKILEEWKETTTRVLTPYQFRPHLERLELNLSAFVGLNLDSMTRDAGWALLDTGRSLERCLVTIGLISLLFENATSRSAEALLCESVLFITDSLRTYQSRFLSAPRKDLTLQLLLGVDDYPRSVLYLIKRMQINLEKLPGEEARNRVLEKLETAEASLRPILSGCESPGRELPFLQDLSDKLEDMSDELTRACFSHAAP